MITTRNKHQKQQFETISSQYYSDNQSLTHYSKISDQILCKITVGFQQSSYIIPIYQNSDIKKIGLKLIVKLYQNLNQEEFQNNFIVIHENVCDNLIKKIQQTVKSLQKKQNIKKSQQWKSKLINLIKNYERQKSKNNKNTKDRQQKQKNQLKYFVKNYQQTKYQTSRTHRTKQHNQSGSKYKTPRVQYTTNLYDKAMKSIQKHSQRQTQNKKLKQQKQQKQCIFKPDISKTQNKIKSKQKKCVFQRLYENANQIQAKRNFKLQQLKTEQNQKENKQCHFQPKINNCSSEIMKIKIANQIQNQNRTILSEINIQEKNNKQKNNFSCEKKVKNFFGLNNFNNESNSNLLNHSFSSINSSSLSQKLLKKQISNKILQGLFDPNHYENRLNKTLKKLNLNQSNQCTFQPQLSSGTQRMTKNYPNFDKRMKVYEIKKLQRSDCQSNQKIKKNNSINKGLKIASKSKSKKTIGPSAQIYQKRKQKGISKYLARIRTQPNFEEPQINNKTIFNSNKQNENILRNYGSEIFKLDSSFPSQQQQSFYYTFTPKQFYSNSMTKTKLKTNEIHVQKTTQQIKNNLFILIFKQFSKNKKQITCYDILKNKQIPIVLKQIISPLIEQLQQMNTSLDCQQFVWSLQNLYQQLSIEKRAILLAYAKKIQKICSNDNQEIKYDRLKHIKTQGSIFQLIQ